MSWGIRYAEWLQRQARNEIVATGSVSIQTMHEMAHHGLDPADVERRIKQQLKESN